MLLNYSKRILQLQKPRLSEAQQSSNRRVVPLCCTFTCRLLQSAASAFHHAVPVGRRVTGAAHSLLPVEALQQSGACVSQSDACLPSGMAAASELWLALSSASLNPNPVACGQHSTTRRPHLICNDPHPMIPEPYVIRPRTSGTI